MTASDPRALSNAELDALLHDLQQRAFAHYEDAAQRAEAEPQHADAVYAQAETMAAPLIAQARSLNDERVRRLRARVRAWRVAAIVIAVLGTGVIVWLMMRG